MRGREKRLDGGQVCLPMCSDREYTSTSTHVALLLSIAFSVGFLGASALLLVLSPVILAPNDEKTEQFVLDITLGIGGLGLLGLVNTGLLVFCGTKKNQTSQIEEINESTFLPYKDRIDYKSI